jgi:Uma2 family endonuclease
MKQVIRAGAAAHKRHNQPEDSGYGWRYVRRVQPDGSEVCDEVPLTLEDLLYPEEGDFVVHEPVHTRDFIYCQSTLEAHYVSQPEVVVLGDCRVDWGVSGVRPLGPDILVLFEVRQWLRRATYRLAEEGGRPVLVIEILSPDTRQQDLRTKRQLYYRVGVEKYVLIDRGPRGDAPVQLIGYQRGRRGWRRLRPDAQGRLDLAPVSMVLGVDDERPWLYDAVTGVRAPDHLEWHHLLTASQTHATAAETRATAAETRATAAEDRAQEEARARALLEARIQALEAQLRRQQDAR